MSSTEADAVSPCVPTPSPFPLSLGRDMPSLSLASESTSVTTTPSQPTVSSRAPGWEGIELGGLTPDGPPRMGSLGTPPPHVHRHLVRYLPVFTTMKWPWQPVA